MQAAATSSSCWELLMQMGQQHVTHRKTPITDLGIYCNVGSGKSLSQQRRHDNGSQCGSSCHEH